MSSFSADEANFLRNSGALSLPNGSCPPGYVYCKELGCVPPDALRQLWPDRKFIQRTDDLTGGGRKKRGRGKSQRRTKKRTIRRKKGKSGRKRSTKK